jgi:hypothetical protein
MRVLIPGLMFGLLVTGCAAVPAQRPTAPRAAPFQAADFVWSTIPGQGAIVGSLRQGAPAAYGCGTVVLMPETPWSRERMRVLYRSDAAAALPAAEVQARSPAPPAELGRFIRRTTCDPRGAFTFSALPAGSWFVITVARPTTPGAAPVALMRRVATQANRSINVELAL